MPAVFALSGEAGTLPLAELSAVLHTYDAKAELHPLASRVYLAETSADPVLIAERAAHVRVGARVLGWLRRATAPPLESILDGLPNPGTFCVRILGGMDAEYASPLIEWLARGVHDSWPDVRVSLDEARLVLYAFAERERVLVAAAPPAPRTRGWATRRPRRRPFFHPTALYPKFARTLVNLTQVSEGGPLLDPYCGTGSILMEAAAIGAIPIGLDVARRMCAGTLANLAFYEIDSSPGVIQADARRAPVRTVHAIATDVPYGREASTWGTAPEELVRRVLEYAVEILAPGRRAVVTHSLPEVRAPPGLRLAERHLWPVHRSLTRRIDVYLRE